MRILVLNAGSSSLKFEVWETSPEQQTLHGDLQRVSDFDTALAEVFARTKAERHIAAVGHRIVHGGEKFRSSAIIDDAVEQEIEALCTLAPLHNPHNLAAVRAARKHWPEAVHVAAFDTAFHHTLPPHAFVYALPYRYLTEKKIRRYGFHGISHQYVSRQFAAIHGRPPEDYRLITCHLGNGCSVCAIRRGKSIDTSMGFTPLEGLVMGTRSGDVDAGAILHLITQEGQKPEDVLHMLNSDSGLKGLSGFSNDMRDVLKGAAEGKEPATLAIDTFCYRVRKYIGAYLAALNGADALIFTGGIGENSAEIRSRICSDMEALGISLDELRNAASEPGGRQIGFNKIPVWVVPTAEELMIARDTARLVAR